MMRITTDPIGMQPTASIPFGHMDRKASGKLYHYRVYGIKYKIFHEQILIKSSMNETLVLSIWIRILVPNFPSTTAWDHTSDPSSKSAMYPNGILAVGCILIGSFVINLI
jgi:hypothetical protein